MDGKLFVVGVGGVENLHNVEGPALGQDKNSNVFFHPFVPLPNGERYDFFLRATSHLAVLSKSCGGGQRSSERKNITATHQLPPEEVAGRSGLSGISPVN